MKAFLIDSAAQTIIEVEYVGGLDAMYALIGCDTVAVVAISGTTDLWVDEEGLLKSPTNYFVVDSKKNILAGNGLVLDHNDEGDCVAASITLVELARRIWFFHDASAKTAERILDECGSFATGPIVYFP